MKTKKRFSQFAIVNLSLVFIFCSLSGQNTRDYTVKLTTSISEDPPAISFNWEPIPGVNSISIYRKSKDTASWGTAIEVLPAASTSYSDNTVEAEKEYEYKIIKTGGLRPVIIYVNAGIKCRETEYRGKVILLVDSTFIYDLKPELTQYENDLIGDGWEILRKDISRNASVKYVKSIIRDFYNSDPVNVKALFLFGHIPVPYSGCAAYDGHTEHIGAWPADIYYGDMKEKTWTDESANCNVAIRSENVNIPGDGKFDLTELPYNETISLQVGRVDLYNLPAFPQSETQLLKNYLIKNHNFRHKINDPRPEALVTDGFGWWEGMAMAISGWRNFTALLNSSHVKSGLYFSDSKFDSYIWSYGCGGGQFTSAASVGSTSDFVNQSPRTVFTCLFGSYFGDWDSQDNFMRSALASKGWTLTCMWSGFPFYTFHQMGMGETIGYCIRSTQNNISTYDANYYNRCVHMSLMGDPTLRMHMVCPPNSMQSAITAKNTIMLAWKPADDSIEGYYVYKLDTLSNEYNRITATPVTNTYFEDTVAVTGSNYYMVRTLKLDKVASGSYYNLSQGIFDTITLVQQTPVLVSGIELSVYPGNVEPVKVFDAFSVDVSILPENATNKLLKWSVESINTLGKFDKYGKIYTQKGGVIVVIAEALDGSGINGRLEITVDSVPDAAGIIVGDDSVCRNAKEFYTIPPVRGATSYLWTLPNGVTRTSISNDLNLTFDKNMTSGNLKVQGCNIYADGVAGTKFITLNEIPTKPVITLIDSVLLSDAPSGNQWYFIKTLIPGALDSKYVPDQFGSYYAKVTLNNCTSLTSNIIHFTPVSVEPKNSKDEIALYPNPTTGELYLSFGSKVAQQVNIEIYDLQGKQVFSESCFNTQNTTIDLSGIPKETYLIKLKLDGNEEYSGRIVLVK